MKLNCAIIDDEPLARECIANYIREIDYLQTVGFGKNPVELTQLLDQHFIDLVFLDIQMPVMNGIEYLRISANAPLVIITTAFPSYALEGFTLDVLDYLLKPITFNRFFQAVTKAKQQHQLKFCGSKINQSDQEASKSFFIKCENKYERLYFKDILYIQALQNYVSIYTKQEKYTTLLSLKTVEGYLKEAPFMRVHKSYIVATEQITAIDQGEIVIGHHRIPMSRSYRDAVMQKVVQQNLWRKE